MTIAIVGAGLAGIAAAVRLTDAGHRVILFERSRYLGGRAGSGFDAATGRELDFGQHVYLYCCERYRWLLDRLGTADLAPLQSPMHIRVIDARHDPAPGKVAALYASPLPTGLHLVPAFLRYSHLSLGERLQTARVLLRLLRYDRKAPDMQRLTFGDWLRQQGTSENAIAAFWNVVTVAALNASVEDVSAAWGLMLFQIGVMEDRRAAEVGIPQVPLSRLVELVRQIVESGGGRLHLQTRVAEVLLHDGRATGLRLTDGTEMPADAVIIATTHKQLHRILPPGTAELPFFSEVGRLPVRPIIDVHLGFSRPVTPRDFGFAVFLHSSVQWLFAHEEGRRLAVSISNPDSLAEAKSARIEEEVVREVQRLFDCGRPDWVAVRRHRNATFDVGPGQDRFRRPQRTPIRGLYVAGDWTDTGWPATMEGAVRSGELAAGTLLMDLT